MFNPFLAACQFQAAMFDGWMRMMACAWQQYGRMALLPQELLDHHHCHGRAHDVAYRGADLKDHYGRRTHDVDVERV